MSVDIPEAFAKTKVFNTTDHELVIITDDQKKKYLGFIERIIDNTVYARGVVRVKDIETVQQITELELKLSDVEVYNQYVFANGHWNSICSAYKKDIETYDKITSSDK